MKKLHFFTYSKMCVLALTGASALFLASCAKDGFTDETFSSSVTNSTLESPELTKDCFSTQVNSDGSESIRVTWKAVMGAGGYEYQAYNVDDPENPVELVNGVVDGVYFTFPKAEDTRYMVKVKTLGNTKLNNTDAPDATSFSYSTMIDAKVIPDGSDIAAYISANMTDSEEEQAFELEADGHYTCNGAVDFMGNKMTLRGNKVSHPVVTFGADGVIHTSAQLKVKWINFDCSEASGKKGVIEMSPNPPATASAESQNVVAGKNSGKPADVYVLMDPILVDDCAFKDVKGSFFTVGDCSWGIADLRIQNCVIQLDFDGSVSSNYALLSAYSNKYTAPSGGQFWYGCIKGMTIRNTTIMNIASNSKNFTIRFNNKDVDRVFPTADGTVTWMDNTFIRIMDGKNFADRTPNQNKYVITFDNNIFYDTWRIQKLIQGNCTVNWHQDQNTTWGVVSTVDGTDKGKWATEEDPGFDLAETKKSLDFTKENFGINLTPTGAISSKIGDPRWLK